MPGIFLFWHFGGHLYFYNNAEAGTRPACNPLPATKADIPSDKIFRSTKFIFILLTLFPLTVLLGQVQTIKIRKEKFVHATFPGGKDSLQSYFNRTVVDIIKYQQNAPDKIRFKSWVDINADGKITKVRLIEGSTFPYIDSLFVNAVRKMPTWKPATNETGKKTKDKQLLPFNVNLIYDDL